MKLLRRLVYILAILFLVVGLGMDEEYSTLSGFVFFFVLVVFGSVFMRSKDEKLDREYKRESIKQMRKKS